MTSLLLYDRPAEGTSARYNLNGVFSSWRRSKRAIGGYHLGSLVIKKLGFPQLTDFYNTWIGMRITENTFGVTSYDGIVWQLDLIKNGINYRRTLNPKYWHNLVQVIYTDANGDQQTIEYGENTDSTQKFGAMEYTYVIGAASDGGATALRDRALVEYAWPKSRTVGSVSVGEPSPLTTGDGLYVTTAGFWTTANWQYIDTDLTQEASTLVSTLIGETETILDGRIETNTISLNVDGSMIPIRLGDALEYVVKQGDTSGNIWKGGVYADKKFNYELAPTTIDYILRNGALYDKAGVAIDPALINPGFYVRDTNAPMGMQPPGTSNIFDNPQVSYCDEVEFVWPDTLRLRFPGESTAVSMLAAQKFYETYLDEYVEKWGPKPSWEDTHDWGFFEDIYNKYTNLPERSTPGGGKGGGHGRARSTPEGGKGEGRGRA